MQIIRRITAIFEAVSANGKLQLNEITRMVGLKKTTVANILKGLLDSGLLEKVEGNKYTIGPGLLSIARDKLKTNSLVGVAEDTARELCGEVNESVCISVLREGERYNVATINVERNLMVSASSEPSHLMYETATGKILLAFSAESEIRKTINKFGYPAEKWDNIKTYAALRKTVAEVRDKRIAFATFSNNEVTCVAVPVFSPGEKIAASVGIGAPTVRLKGAHKDNVIKELFKAAERMAGRLSFGLFL